MESEGQSPFASRSIQRLIVCDTDAIIEIFCAKFDWIFRQLQNDYGFVFAVTEAVEAEVLRPGRKLGFCCQDGFRKALETGRITVLNPRTLGQFSTNNSFVTYDSIDLLGQEYYTIIDRGEAYTHAAAHVLKCFVLSNDWKAIRDCDRRGVNLDHTTLRVYDLLVLLHQNGSITEKQCDAFRKALHECGEVPHEAFASRKFREGLPAFYPRLVDPDFHPIGSPNMTQLGDQLRVEIKKLRLTANE